MNDRQGEPLTEGVEVCARPCRPVPWFTHRTVSGPKGKEE